METHFVIDGKGSKLEDITELINRIADFQKDHHNIAIDVVVNM